MKNIIEECCHWLKMYNNLTLDTVHVLTENSTHIFDMRN